MIIEKKFDPRTSFVDVVLLDDELDDDGNPTTIVRFTDKLNHTEVYRFPGHPLEQPMRDPDFLPHELRETVLRLKRDLLETENLVLELNLDWFMEEGLARRNVGPSETVRMFDEKAAKDLMVELSRLQYGHEEEGGDGDWFTWEDQDSWDATIYPAMLEYFIWDTPRDGEGSPPRTGRKPAATESKPHDKPRAQTDFTDEQENAIGGFYNDFVDFLESHLHKDSPLHPLDVYDYDEDKFIETIADELAGECADHGILLNFPEHVTYPDGYERWSDHPYPNDSVDARRFVDKIKGKRDA